MMQRILFLALLAVLIGGIIVFLLPPTLTGKNHLEHCIASWAYSDGQLSTSNTCNEIIVIRFRSEGEQDIVVRHLKPREVFQTAFSGKGWFMFTACPVGYVSSIPFLPENRKQIMDSRYVCVRE